MSKELDEALKNIKIRCHSKVVWYDPIDFDLEIVDQALIKAQEQEKVLNIIIEKNVDVLTLNSWFSKGIGDLKTYNYDLEDEDKLTQEEFDLLKKYFNENKEGKEVR